MYFFVIRHYLHGITASFWLLEELELRRRRARFTFLLSVVSSVIFAAKRQRRTDGLRQFPPSSPPFPGLQLRSSSSSSCYIEEPILSYFSRAARTNSGVILNLLLLPFAREGKMMRVDGGGFGQR